MASLAEYATALRFRDVLDTLVQKVVQENRPRYQYATVQSIDRTNYKCAVRFPGETADSNVKMGSIQPVGPGQVVRIDGLAGDRFISDVIGPSVSTFRDIAADNISGGGVCSVDTSYYVKWSQRFLVISAGRSARSASVGHFSIDCPTSGTITGVGGASNKTATAAGIPLVAYEALYYILPLGSIQTSVPANFRVVSYTSDFEIPADWVFLAVRNGDGSGAGAGVAADTVKFCNGQSMTPWITPSLSNGWLHYAAPYGPGRYRKWNGLVVGNGILASGTLLAAAFVFPVGWRPATNQILTAATSPLAGAPYYSEIRIDPATGNCLMQTGLAGYMSLANINFVAEA